MLAVFGVAASTLGDEDVTFGEYLAVHGKSYGAHEIASRRARFERTRRSVVKQNERFRDGTSTWWAAINAMADATDGELARVGASHHHGVAPRARATRPLARAAATRTNPVEKDWMDVQSPVKNQASCGSCWSFGATEALESHLAIAENSTAGAPLILAPQTMVSCAKNPKHCGGTGGCEGATAEIAFNYTKASGIALEAEYPYTGKDAACKSGYAASVTCEGYTKLPINSAAAMEEALATKGPVAVVVAANWATYGGGVFADGCLSWLGSCTLDHVVVVVGYTAESWLVRNSWGANWGEEGYIRLSRKNDNTTYTDSKPSQGNACAPFPPQQSVKGECGVLFDASYPTGVARV